MAILLITNRNLVPGRSDEKTFGDRFNAKGPMELRIAQAWKKDGDWHVNVLKERNLSGRNLPSRDQFFTFRETLIDGERNCVFFVHGHNQNLRKNLEKCAELESYGVDVVAFSWPSRPGGFLVSKYQRSRRAAELSAPALDRAFEKLIGYFQELKDEPCNISFNLVIHSLGNYVFQNFVEGRLLNGETRLFDNILLHQADVDSEGHGRWVSKLRYARRIYVTHNENDKVLGFSDLVNPDRLGNTVGNAEVPTVRYVDFTNSGLVLDDHRMWEQARDNPAIEAFYKAVFHGEPAENTPNIAYDPDRNLYSVA